MTIFYLSGIRASHLVIKCAITTLTTSRLGSPFAHLTLNTYLSVMRTFLAIITKHAEALSVLECSIPWHNLTHLRMPPPCTYRPQLKPDAILLLKVRDEGLDAALVLHVT
jgi:hypothetical protein